MNIFKVNVVLIFRIDTRPYKSNKRDHIVAANERIDRSKPAQAKLDPLTAAATSNRRQSKVDHSQPEKASLHRPVSMYAHESNHTMDQQVLERTSKVSAIAKLLQLDVD